ncbi:MAG: bacterial regulatory, tetR family protein [Proteobacteria bacterium]|nr:bacterial regulatory, tetR family protein [Pseudomonadota bacterium]
MTAARRHTPAARARAETQRERILDAAQKCFIERGFRGASMAQIAQTAAISVGLAYRYFDGKDAIMLAIIARQLEAKRARIDQLCAEADFLGAVLERFRVWQRGLADAMNPALFLEMSAEATRSPRIAEAIRTSDALLKAEFESWLLRERREGGLGIGAQDVQARGLLVQCLFEGLLVRAARDPDQDVAVLRRALEPVFSALGLVPDGHDRS